MTLRNRFLLFFALCAVLVVGNGTYAQTVPSSITVQGFLSDTSGGSAVPANGTFGMLFDVYDADTGGNLIASAGPLNVTVTDGRYEAKLPFSPAHFEQAVRWMEITVSGELLTPRIRLVSVPFAFNAARADSVADGAIDADALAAGAVTADALGIPCGDGEILVYTVGVGWSCGAPGGAAPRVCDPGTYAHCYTGATGTSGIGVCQEGRADCLPDQTGFDNCTGEIVPSTEDCTNGVDDDCDGGIDCADSDCTSDPACTACPDNDSDGFTDDACGGNDCDDTNASINPGATEICDTLDNNCDGQVDEGGVCGATEICDNGVDDDADGDIDCADGDCMSDPACTACPDNDSDGFTDDACGGNDCDDTNASINPGATEICDTVDNNCDGQVDEGGVCGATCINGIMDGDETDVDCGGSCSPCNGGQNCLFGSDCSSGTCVANQCSDVEICDNGVDDDADGDIDCADSDCTSDPACTGCPDNDSDGFADDTCGGNDCDDTNASINPAASELCDGLDNDCDPGSGDGQDEAQLGQACDGSDTDLCLEGVFSCDFGSLECSDNTTSTAELCANGVDDDCDGGIDCADGDCTTDPACTGCPDSDSDGFTDDTCGGNDCDDTNASINPGATEICDTLDNNCDGQVDEGGVCGATEICDNGVDDDADGDIDCADGDCMSDPACTACPDNDSDGFTDDACGGNDCDDTNASINPGATEICDTVDNNCDGQVDEGGVCGATCINGIMDGDETDVDCGGSCSPCNGGQNCLFGSDCSSGTCVANQCSDVEICDNGVDDDADGDIDCADSDCTSDPACTGCPDNDSDGFADDTCGGNDCDDTNASINPAASELCDGLDNDCDPGSGDGQDEAQLGQACDGSDTDLCLEGVFSCDFGSLECSDNTTSTAELCANGVDDDCDGGIDCADGDCTTDPACTACPDNDSDGFTDDTCGGNDCDDTNASINPGATEICDTVDNNCDGQVDEGGVCTATCSNGVMDGDETDVDCGGSCSTCSSGQSCLLGSDCSSGTCNVNVCF